MTNWFALAVYIAFFVWVCSKNCSVYLNRCVCFCLCVECIFMRAAACTIQRHFCFAYAQCCCFHYSASFVVWFFSFNLLLARFFGKRLFFRILLDFFRMLMSRWNYWIFLFSDKTKTVAMNFSIDCPWFHQINLACIFDIWSKQFYCSNALIQYRLSHIFNGSFY